MDTATVAAFNQILLGIAIPILVGAAVSVAIKLCQELESKIPANRLHQLMLAVSMVADAARKSGLLTELTAKEASIETALVASAQAFCDAHHIPIGSLKSLETLVKAELLADIKKVQAGKG
jgi:hypothetical protein